jgi:hypothetical protein
MAKKKDFKAFALLVKYCEDEAVRLAASPVIIHCLRMVNVELTNSTLNQLSMLPPDLYTKH